MRCNSSMKTKKKNNAAEDNSPSSSWKMTQSPLAPTPPLPTHLTPSVRDTARNFLEFSTNTRSRRLENGNFAQKKNENWILFFFFFFIIVYDSSYSFKIRIRPPCVGGLQYLFPRHRRSRSLLDRSPQLAAGPCNEGEIPQQIIEKEGLMPAHPDPRPPSVVALTCGPREATTLIIQLAVNSTL